MFIFFGYAELGLLSLSAAYTCPSTENGAWLDPFKVDGFAKVTSYI